jgi:predicted Zn finger-like uncharacterized protein
MIRFSCPGCGATYSVDDSKGGKTGKCPKCQSHFQIPMPEGSAASPAYGSGPSASLPPTPPADPNAPVEIAPCPGCQARLSVATSDLGADVECPYCKTVYKATKPGTGVVPVPPSSRVDRDEERPGRRRVEEDEDRPSRRRRDEDDEDDRPSRRRRRGEEDEDRPSRRRRDEDDEGDRPSRRFRDEDEEDERPRRRRRRRGASEEAESAVSVPAIILIVLGILGLVYGLINIVVVVTGMGGPGPFGQPKNGAEQVGRMVGSVLPIIWGAIVTLGGFKMKSLSGRGSAMLGAIFAMLPCSPCCLLGLPIGIWAVVVLNRDDVKRAFD